MSDTRYIDPETGKLRDSKRSELIGGIAGGTAGILAINPLAEYATFKQGLTEQAHIPEVIKGIEGTIEKDRLDLEMADLARAYQTDPSVLDQYPEDARDIIRRDIDLMGRLNEREKWDRFNELPLKERLRMFVKGKPSLDGFDLNVADELTNIYGPQPLHPEVSGFLRDEIAQNERSIDGLRSLMDEKVRYDWRRAAPSLDHVKPRNLFRTVTNPYVTTGLFTGALAGTAYDEYRKHKAVIERREAEKLEKAAALKLPKLKLPKTKGAQMPKKEPLLPKNVKRVGILAGAAGTAGYTGIKGVQHYQDGAAYAGRIQDGGMAAKSPDQLRKERERMMKGAQETNQEGMDLHMKTAHEKYLELEKVAGIGNTLKKGLDQVRGTNVKQSQKMLDDMAAAKASEPMMDAAQSIHAKQKKATNTARAIVGGSAAVGAGGAALAASKGRAEREKTAYEKYLELEKMAGIGDKAKKGLEELGQKIKSNADEVGQKVKDGVDSAGQKLKSGKEEVGQKVKSGIDELSGENVKQSQKRLDDMAEAGASEPMMEVGQALHNKQKQSTNKARIIAGASVAGVAGGAGGAALAASKRRDEEKTAYEKYLELEKVAAIPGVNALKKGWGHLSGKKVKANQTALDTSIMYGDDIGTVQEIQKNLDHSKKMRNIARGAVGTGAAAGAAAGAGGVMAAKSNEREKIAGDVSVEDSEYALEHPFKKSVRDFSGTGARIGAAAGGLGGAALGLVSGGLPSATAGAMVGGPVGAALGLTGAAALGGLGGAALGGLGGGAIGGVGGAIASYPREVANVGLDQGLSGTALGALGGGLAGGMVGLRGASSKSPNALAGQIASHGLVGAVPGALIGRNQEMHHNNVVNDEFATNRALKRKQGAADIVDADDAIDKAADEVINELFKEASMAIQEAPMEKVAGVTSPISKIDGTLFGYDRLK